jgi:hypothetical protein
MALNLEVEQSLDATAQPVKDQNGNASPLALSTAAVGIGTTQPASPLTVAGPENVGPRSAAIELNNTSANGRRFEIGASLEGYFQIADLTAGGATRLMVNPDGNVGIGTLEPSSPLTVAGQANVGPGSAAIELNNTSKRGRRFEIGAALEGYFQIADLTAGGATRLVVDLDGNVGIGTLEPTEMLVVAGNILATGDVKLSGADCAEDFAVDDLMSLEPGMVMVISEGEALCRCTHAYDRRVAGVLSGAGQYRPGIILGKQAREGLHLPLALTGKVYCLVDASYSPVDTGDLLTTSPTPGHAMKASDAGRAFGAVLGKALRPLSDGCALIPILCSLN